MTENSTPQPATFIRGNDRPYEGTAGDCTVALKEVRKEIGRHDEASQ
jgi:hypothetical protein